MRIERFSPRFFGRIGRVELSVGNPSEKLRIGTLPIEESLAQRDSEMHTVSPSEICTTFSRTGALARAVHKVISAQSARLAYALRGGWLSAFTPPFGSLGQGEAQRKRRKRPEAAEKKNQRSPTCPGSPRSSKSGKNSFQPAKTPVQADAGALPKQSTGRP